MPPSSPPRLNAPIVLAHGFLGFDFVRMGGRKVLSYFPGIPDVLGATGTRVLVARVSPTASIVQRAAELKAFLDRELPNEPCHLFAHSMGGLDSRYMITHLGMADRVLTLTTIGTPHRGSGLADWGVRRVMPLVKPVFHLFRVPWQGVSDLTVEACRDFNDRVPDAPQVRYFSVAGRLQPGWRKWHMHLSEGYLRKREGPNDGLVSVASATYGEDCQVWDGDHLDIVNWQHPVPLLRRRNRFDFATGYIRLAQRLADAGF